MRPARGAGLRSIESDITELQSLTLAQLELQASRTIWGVELVSGLRGEGVRESDPST